MNLTKHDLLIVKINITMNLIEWCSDILDEEYQERIWIRNDGPEIGCFHECSLEVDYDLDTLIETSESQDLSPTQKSIIERFHFYIETIDVEHEDGTSRGGYQDQASDWLELKSAARLVVPELAKFLLKTKVHKIAKTFSDELSASRWKKIATNPLCKFTPEQTKQLIALVGSSKSKD